MSTLPNDWLALLAVAYTLGLKHGMDPDHLATMDGIARSNAARNPRLARGSGLLFSAGHGAIVILVAIGVSVVAREWETPARLFFPAIAGHAPDRQLLFGGAAVAIIGLSFLIGLFLTQAPARLRPPGHIPAATGSWLRTG